MFIVSWLWDNLQVNSQRQNIPTSFDYLDQPAGFPIANSAFRQTQPVHAALVVGLLNTLRLAVVGIVLATVLGTLLGVARLSKNFLVRKIAQVYVETVRNVPLLGIIILIYLAVVLNMFPEPNDALRIGPLAVISVRGATLRVLRRRHVEVPGGRRRARPLHVGGRALAAGDRRPTRRGGPRRMVGARHRSGRARRAVAGARPRGIDTHA